MSLCPVCSKPTVAIQAPFCSERCRLVDLNKWFTGAYATQAVELDDVDPAELDRLTEENPED